MFSISNRPPNGYSRAFATAISRIALALLLGVGALQVHAAPLTLEDALRLAQERSRQLPAQEASAAAAREMAIAAANRPASHGEERGSGSAA